MSVAGKVRALATMATQRIEPRPDLPTVSESGYKDFETDVWFGLVAPAKTPKETVTQLIDWFRTALLAPEVKAKLTAQALYPNPKCGADFDAHLQRQSDLYARLIGDLNIKKEYDAQARLSSAFFSPTVGLRKNTSIVQPLGAVGAWWLPLGRITKLPAVHSPSVSTSEPSSTNVCSRSSCTCAGIPAPGSSFDRMVSMSVTGS